MRLDDLTRALSRAGAADTAERVAELESDLTPSLRPLARVAYNYVWSWLPDGDQVFRDISPLRWEQSGRNPVRFLFDLWPSTMAHAEDDPALRARISSLVERVDAYLAEPMREQPGVTAPIVYLCSEFGVHESLPVYSGGLGVLAGDTIKEASDKHLPLLAVGLFYRLGYFRQRLDLDGRQLEYWLASDPKAMPMARVSLDGTPLTVELEVNGRPLFARIWRVDVGRVPLFLLDADVPGNDQVRRWTTARLYDGEPTIRLAQYALLGRGSIDALEQMGIEPGIVHLNEGHPASAALELAARAVARGRTFADAWTETRERVVFTTHTPVAAGNETYPTDDLLKMFGDLPTRLSLPPDKLVELTRTPGETDGGMSALALRASRTRNAVSRLHGDVSRAMWSRLFGVSAEEVEIGHVTNGVHLPTFVTPTFAALFERHLGDGWRTNPGDPGSWEAIADVPDAELWAARCEARAELIEQVRVRSEHDRLLRGEDVEYVRAAAESLDPAALTLGFARRLASYKRVNLLASDSDRLLRLLTGDPPVQLLLAGKAHPRDPAGKEALRSLFDLKRSTPPAARRIVVLEDYNLALGRALTGGCDVWINLPRRPMEASGTSGMKATLNGGLQLSVLDGWWAEAYDGTNGWGIDGIEADPELADERDAAEFYDLLERQVVPLFHERGPDGVPTGWCALMKRAIATCAGRFTTARMLDEYVTQIYRTP